MIQFIYSLNQKLEETQEPIVVLVTSNTSVVTANGETLYT